MNAAAARALDCFSMRDCDDGMTKAVPTRQLCDNAPYLHDHGPLLPEIPTGVSLPKQS